MGEKDLESPAAWFQQGRVNWSYTRRKQNQSGHSQNTEMNELKNPV